ncbi:MAG: aminotransferase class V-fold PLP-dependent enzyme, partial [Methanomicrobiales archaeon]|nr:aminotransferase class V-fold PLP-dependent enzyme [Methanomicrobiales archaeon]
FAGDRMPGPSGIGVLWMRDPSLGPLYVGGGMGAAADYLAGIGMDRIRQHVMHLAARMIDGLRCLPGVKVCGPENAENRTGIVSFTVEGMDPRDVAVHLDEASDILVGAGDHDCQLLMEHLGITGGTVRASVYLYTTEQEVDLLVATVAELVKG